MGEEDRHYEVSEGHVLILRPDCHHYPVKDCDKATDHYWVHFQSYAAWSPLDEHTAQQWLHHENINIQTTNSLIVQSTPILTRQFSKIQQPGKFMNALDQLLEMNASAHKNEVRWQQQTQFQEVLQLLSISSTSASTPSTACAQTAASYLRKHYQEQITAESMGQELNFHPVYIARCMQKEFGLAPFEYLLRYRIEQSKLLLRQTSMTIARISEEVGFNQPAYYTACFVKLEGITPKDYRKRALHAFP